MRSLEPLIFRFAKDFGSQSGLPVCQNLQMITFAVAGTLVLLNLALISTILSFDQLFG